MGPAAVVVAGAAAATMVPILMVLVAAAAALAGVEPLGRAPVALAAAAVLAFWPSKAVFRSIIRSLFADRGARAVRVDEPGLVRAAA